VTMFNFFVGNPNIPVPPRPSSSQSDGSGPPRMSQSPMSGPGGQSKLTEYHIWILWIVFYELLN